MPNLYSIYDKKTLSYGPPVMLENDATAERAFIGLVSDVSSMLGKYPEDFVMRRLGDFNRDTGFIDAIAAVDVADGLTYAHKFRPVVDAEEV